jgi:hypothetical protein
MSSIGPSPDLETLVKTTFVNKDAQHFWHYVPTIRVYYVGKDPDNQEDFSQAMSWQKEEKQAGVHCFTFELETEEHLDSSASPSAKEEKSRKKEIGLS